MENQKIENKVIGVIPKQRLIEMTKTNNDEETNTDNQKQSQRRCVAYSFACKVFFRQIPGPGKQVVDCSIGATIQFERDPQELLHKIKKGAADFLIFLATLRAENAGQWLAAIQAMNFAWQGGLRHSCYQAKQEVWIL